MFVDAILWSLIQESSNLTFDFSWVTLYIGLWHIILPDNLFLLVQPVNLLHLEVLLEQVQLCSQFSFLLLTLMQPVLNTD